jgi:hypothetical protein
MEGLGRLFDIVAGVVPVDFATAGATGNRVNLKNAGGVTIVAFVGAAASGTEAQEFDVQEHSAASGGTSQDLNVVDHFYTKYEATLDGDETWSLATQDPAASEVTIAGADRDKQGIVVIEIEASQLSDGFNWISLNVADPGTVARLGGVLYLLRDLAVQRAPANLANPQAA